MTGRDRAYRENKHGDVDATAIHPTITNYGSQKKSKSKSKPRRLPPKSIEIDRFLKSHNRPNTIDNCSKNVLQHKSCQLLGIMELSHLRTFVPGSKSTMVWNFRSLEPSFQELSLPGTFAPWNFRTRERVSRTFAPTTFVMDMYAYAVASQF